MAKFDLGVVKGKFKEDKAKRQILIAAVLFVIIVIILYINFFFRPAFKELKGLMSESKQLTMKVFETRRVIAENPRLEQQKDSLKGKIDFYEKKLSHRKEIPKLLENLSKIANESGVKIDAIKPARAAGKEAAGDQIYQEIPINIDANCGYHELGSFLQKLEYAREFMKITNISIVDDPSSIKNHKVKLEIATYALTKGSQ